MTVIEEIQWLEVLSNGYSKPDLRKNCCDGNTGTVRETKNFFHYIDAINKDLAKKANIKIEQ